MKTFRNTAFAATVSVFTLTAASTTFAEGFDLFGVLDKTKKAAEKVGAAAKKVKETKDVATGKTQPASADSQNWKVSFSKEGDSPIVTMSIFKEGSSNAHQVEQLHEDDDLISFDVVKDGEIEYQDINFDGIKDFMFIPFYPAGPNTPYIYYLYNPSSDKFERNKELENISDPIINSSQKTITSEVRGNACAYWTDTFQFAGTDLKRTKRVWKSYCDSYKPEKGDYVIKDGKEVAF